ncbi:5-formyltetrahydrofolate cyclo-ligase [Microvirga sp. W0021]|uniref:5-formyltetrahydrofolate cyclo-ligase n=1 Tax=Hohaiivirga grylli TaxID=3133970 RepID=A0ABV0BLY7_9HYPH
MMNQLPTGDVKRNLRQEILAKRDLLPDDLRRAASLCICAHLKDIPEVTSAVTIAAFWPMRSEVDLRSLFNGWSDSGHQVGLPVMQPDNKLVFRKWSATCLMEEKQFGVMELPETCEQIIPDILLVPLVAFDQKGNRLGYGKGFYDRAIAELVSKQKIVTIGIAFAIQEVAALPVEAHDQPLDMIVTEAGIRRVKR